jgi:hypothetical protein
MVAFYVFSLVLGGGFLALSVFGDLFGGHGDVDFGGDVGGLDGDLGLDAGHLDVDAGHIGVDAGHLDVQATHAGLQADAGHLASKIFSIRTLFYSLFGFGSVGTLLTFVWSGNPFLTAAFAVVSGVASGALINGAFSYVKRTESGALQSETTYAGMQGRVTLPIRRDVPGKIVVERGGRRLELRALPHPSAAGQGDPASWRSVMVVEMERGVARVAPLEDFLLES